MTSMIKFGCGLVFLFFFAASASAQGYDYDELAGQVFWVRPTPEVFRRLEFYRQPNLTAVSFYPQGKKSFRIVNVTRGWIKLNFINSFSQFEEAFIPLGYLRRNTYSLKTYNEYAFKRATFFNEDPDQIEERAKEAAMSPAVPTVKAKSAASKFFRHKKKIDAMNQANQTSQKTPIPQQ